MTKSPVPFTETPAQEVGYFLPAAGSSIAWYWITDDIVYSIDLVRGIDILRFHR